MSAIWRAVAAWFAGAFLRRGEQWSQPWNSVSARVLSEDLHLPFEAYSLTPPEVVTPEPVAEPVFEPAPPAPALPPAAEVAKREASFFPGIDVGVLAKTIAAYQKLGNWSPHVEITRPAFEATLDIYQHAGRIKKRHRYEDAIAQPPA